MAFLTARITYKSRRQFLFSKRGAEAKIYFDRVDWKNRGTRYYIQTYRGAGKPKEDTSGFKLELDEESMQHLLTALNEMIAAGPQPR